jgi:hypothetical protein
MSAPPGLRLKFAMVQGKWNVTINTPMGDRTGVLELHVQGNSLTGSLSDGEHLVAITEGKVAGNNLQWQAKITKPMRLTFKFTAAIEGDRISGSARHMLGTATFSGTRA